MKSFFVPNLFCASNMKYWDMIIDYSTSILYHVVVTTTCMTNYICILTTVLTNIFVILTILFLQCIIISVPGSLISVPVRFDK